MTRANSPVIASKVGPFAPLRDGVDALLVKENTVEAWYKAIKQLVESPKAAADPGGKCYQAPQQ
jgi:glycosyltransferase involved in cell wall biosynthesis